MDLPHPEFHSASCPRCGGTHRPATACTPTYAAVGQVPPGEPDPLLGAVVGNFRLLRRLGQGGMATVYLAEHPVIGSQVAVKLLHPVLATDPAMVRRFYDEARAAHRVAHQNIVQVLDLGMAPMLGLYIVMEYVPGQTLAQRLLDGRLPLDFAEAVLAQICAALSSAHARGVVHRDLKPDNILITEQQGAPFVKVTDFGIAKLRDDLGTGTTLSGDVLGTPLYMAPEQVQGQPVDARTDVYALGVIAYELATGRRPFDGKPREVMDAQLSQAPRPPRELREELPACWDAAILRALAKRAEERFADAGAFLAALRTPVLQASAPASHGPVVEVEVEFGAGVPPIALRALDVSIGGALIGFPGAPPPLLSRVRVLLGEGEARVCVDAEVVRHIGEADARTWNLPPGFAVQFRSPPAELARALESVHPRAARPPARATAAVDLALRKSVQRFASRVAASHYELLGLSLDATQAQVLERGKHLVAELRAIEAAGPGRTDGEQISGALARAASAIATLGNRRERLRYDARLGNFRGVARALREGLPAGLLEEEHQRFLAAHPGARSRTAVYLGLVRHERERGDLERARYELEYALAGDPLHPELQALWRELPRAA